MKKTVKTSKKIVSKSVAAPVAESVPAVSSPPSPAATATQPVAAPAVTSPVAVASQNASQDPGALPPTGTVVPKPPTDWKPTKLGRGKGARGKQGQVSNAAVAGKELGDSTTYASDFGPHAPSQARLARLMTGAAGWRGQWVSSKRWTAYAAQQNASWWEATLESADLLQPAFDYAVARDPSIADRYPSTTQFMQAASLIAKRGASVRKANAPSEGPKTKTPKGKVKAAAAPPTPTPLAPETAVDAAPAPAVVTPGR